MEHVTLDFKCKVTAEAFTLNCITIYYVDSQFGRHLNINLNLFCY